MNSASTINKDDSIPLVNKREIFNKWQVRGFKELMTSKIFFSSILIILLVGVGTFLVFNFVELKKTQNRISEMERDK